MNSFSASGGGNFEQKFSINSNVRGVARGGGCLSFDLTGTLVARLAQQWIKERGIIDMHVRANEPNEPAVSRLE